MLSDTSILSCSALLPTVQWGNTTAGTNTAFPISFTTECWSVMITDAIGGSSTSANAFGCKTDIALDYFRVIGPAGDGVLWFAAGY